MRAMSYVRGGEKFADSGRFAFHIANDREEWGADNSSDIRTSVKLAGFGEVVAEHISRYDHHLRRNLPAMTGIAHL